MIASSSSLRPRVAVERRIFLALACSDVFAGFFAPTVVRVTVFRVGVDGLGPMAYCWSNSSNGCELVWVRDAVAMSLVMCAKLCFP